MRVDNLGANGMKDIITRLEKLERATPMNNASIGRNGLRVHSGGVITIQNGGLSITGTAEVLGQFMGSGTLTWTGPVNFTGQTNLDGPTDIDGATTINGATSITGTTTVTGAMNILGDVDITKTLDITGATKIMSTLDITGNTKIMGTTTLSDTLTVTSGGTIKVGSNMTLSPSVAGGAVSFGSGGSLYADGSGVQMDNGSTFVRAGANQVTIRGAGAVALVVGGTGAQVTGDLTVSGAKNFRMEHPLIPNHWLQHGSTESPISGTEYTGRGTFDAHGECEVALPSYFESLNKPANRTIQLTPTGKPYAVGADEIENGSFTAYGTPGRSFFWLVKGERFGGDFDVELVREAEDPTLLQDENSGQ